MQPHPVHNKKGPATLFFKAAATAGAAVLGALPQAVQRLLPPNLRPEGEARLNTQLEELRKMRERAQALLVDTPPNTPTRTEPTQ